MQIITSVLPGTLRLRRITDLSRDANKRLQWFDYYETHGKNARLACRYFGISCQTFYRWKRRYDPKNLKSLEGRSCCPKHVRQPTASSEITEAVRQLREVNPRWGKEKLARLLQKQDYQVSVSMVGRILHRLKE